MMSLSRTWWQIGPALAARGWDVTAIDLAAHGGNTLTGPLTVDALVDSVTAQVGGPIDVLIGHSMGAATAITAAARHPGLARAVVLEDPPSAPRTNAEELATGVELDSDIARLDRDRLVRRSRADHPGWADEDVEGDVVGIEQADAESVAAGLRAGLLDWDVPAELRAAGVPNLLLAATEGSALQGIARDRVRAAAGSWVELPGGHCLHRDVPERWLAAVEDFRRP
jgi:pimeloyl-ACP methyl ester carboxylesterase